jgi:hypothetical protein
MGTDRNHPRGIPAGPMAQDSTQSARASHVSEFPCSADEFDSITVTMPRKFDRCQKPASARQLGSVAAHRVWTYCDDEATEAAHHGQGTAMNIAPTCFEEQINRGDRRRGLPDPLRQRHLNRSRPLKSGERRNRRRRWHRSCRRRPGRHRRRRQMRCGACTPRSGYGRCNRGCRRGKWQRRRRRLR